MTRKKLKIELLNLFSDLESVPQFTRDSLMAASTAAGFGGEIAPYVAAVFGIDKKLVAKADERYGQHLIDTEKEDWTAQLRMT